MNPLDKFLSDGAKVDHDVKLVLADDFALKVALVLVGAIILNAVVRKVLGV